MRLAAVAGTARVRGRGAASNWSSTRESGAEGEAVAALARYSALKRALETALSRPVEIALTRDRQRVYEWMERNQADVFMTNAADLAQRR